MAVTLFMSVLGRESLHFVWNILLFVVELLCGGKRFGWEGGIFPYDLVGGGWAASSVANTTLRALAHRSSPSWGWV